MGTMTELEFNEQNQQVPEKIMTPRGSVVIGYDNWVEELGHHSIFEFWEGHTVAVPHSVITDHDPEKQEITMSESAAITRGLI